MAAQFWMNARRMAGIALALLALAPAAASAASFERVVQAPGGDELAVIKGVPHVAYAAADGVRVARLTTGNFWQPVGGAVRHKAGDPVSSPSLTSDPSGALWLVWTETDSTGTAQARVATFANGSWHEVVGGERPINITIPQASEIPWSAFEPQIVFFAGRPYVAYIQDSLSEYVLEAVRLSDDGTKWEHVRPPLTSRPEHSRLAASGGRLYVAAEAVFGPGIFVFRLNEDGKTWEDVGRTGEGDTYQRPADIADLAGSPVVGYVGNAPNRTSPPGLHAKTLQPDGQWSDVGPAVPVASDDERFEPQGTAADGSVAYVSALRGPEGSRRLIVSRFAGGTSEALESPSDPDANATSSVLAPGSPGMWLLFGQTRNGTTSYYLDSLGAALPPDDPGGAPEPPSGPPEPASGLCSNVISGSSLGERLNGTRRSDAIFGRGGNDRVNAFAASDCLYGGSGHDTLNGGRGNDFFRGGSGNDRIRGDSGNDDINGDRGNDRIVGGTGNDEIDAGRGNDVVNVARQGADLVACGPGRDTIVISLADRYRGCERVVLRR
jgi:hypothetical protein